MPVYCDEIRATRMVALLLQVGIQSANAMSKEEACREYARLQRRMNPFKGRPMNLQQLAAKSSYNRRRKKNRRG